MGKKARNAGNKKSKTCDKLMKLNKLQALLLLHKIFRPVGCEFLDECCTGSFWISRGSAKKDFPTCTVKQYVTTGEILKHLMKHNLEPEDIELYQ